MSLYARLAATPEGERALAKSRLVRELGNAFSTASRGRTMFDTDLTWRDRWRLRRRLASWPSTIGAVAEYLHAYGYELELTLVPAGQPRAEVLARRQQHADQEGASGD